MLVVNNLGGTSNLELCIMTNAAIRYLGEQLPPSLPPLSLSPLYSSLFPDKFDLYMCLQTLIIIGSFGKTFHYCNVIRTVWLSSAYNFNYMYTVTILF